MSESRASEEHREDLIKAIKVEIWDRAFYASATAAIFGYRAEKLKRRLQLLTFVALAVPIVVGGLALAYGAGFRFLHLAVAIGALVGLVQLVISLWSVVATWVEEYGYSAASLVDNSQIAQELEELANEPLELDELRQRYVALKARDTARRAQDYTHGVTDQEKRRGHRSALRDRGRKCAGCGEVPTSIKPSTCGVCGDFKNRAI
ncbi:hypothetical protein KBX37_21675 [Micromonospora sp. U56]|uniref:mobilome CxxCx(11)CxxC protein n=1 Tax=Micromonospora sp. U56 TaxID=2824900 RepID=UPI001B3753B0|nr:mobilome CxxCx(11)CxxC protein [Micromonospora sp. U56]MBQ0895672.1 hypothetical protein [Micromonospora sp. U56]